MSILGLEMEKREANHAALYEWQKGNGFRPERRIRFEDYLEMLQLVACAAGAHKTWGDGK